MMENKNIVISGTGFISPLGFDLESYWMKRKCVSESSVVRDVRTITDFDPKKYIRRPYIKSLDRTTRYCMSAIKLAIDNAKIDTAGERGAGIGIFTGSMYHGIESIFNMKTSFFEEGVEGISPLYFPGTVFNASGAQAAIEWNIRGPNCVINDGMVSGLSSVIKGIDYLQIGKVATALAGGHEMSHEFITAQMKQKGFIGGTTSAGLGEGSCYFVLEEREAAENRKSGFFCEIQNYAHAFCPDKSEIPADFKRCIDNTLSDGGCGNPRKPDLIICDLCGYPGLDNVILSAIEESIEGAKVIITSNKWHLGHTLGASGAFNVLDACLAIRNQEIPAPHRLFPADGAAVDIDVPVERVLVTALDPDGNIAALLVKKGDTNA